MGIVWIASYPKSGNTWVRFLLANYLAGPIERTSQIESLIPYVDHQTKLGRLLAQRPVVYAKSHNAWGPGHPYQAQTQRSVVIVRHPKDVLLSNLNYQRLVRGHDGQFEDADYVRVFLQSGGDPRWHAIGFGSLERNVRSWIDAPEKPPRLVLRYESLKEDAAGGLRTLLEFLNLPIDDARIRVAAAASSFERMRAIEVREKTANRQSEVFAGPAPRPDWQRFFMNQASTRHSLAHIDPELDREFDRRFAPLLERLGYAA